MTASAPAASGWWRGSIEAVSLSFRLFRRTIGAKYRKSFLGYFWMVAPALLITGAAALARDGGVLPKGSSALPDWLAVFLGTLLWQVFAETIDVPYQAFESARGYLTRVNFSRAAAVLAQLHEALLITAVRLAVVLVLLAACGHWHAGTWLVPVAFAGTLAIGLGAGCFLLPWQQLFADVQQTLKLLLGYGLFLTPALYEPKPGWLATIVACNPVSPLIVAAREAAGGAALSQPFAFAAMLAVGVAASVAGFVLVRVVAPILIERMLLGGR